MKAAPDATKRPLVLPASTSSGSTARLHDSIDALVFGLWVRFVALGLPCVSTGLFCVLQMPPSIWRKGFLGDHTRLAEREVAGTAVRRLADDQVIEQRDLKEFPARRRVSRTSASLGLGSPEG